MEKNLILQIFLKKSIKFATHQFFLKYQYKYISDFSYGLLDFFRQKELINMDLIKNKKNVFGIMKIREFSV